jgi:arylsulfatase
MSASVNALAHTFDVVSSFAHNRCRRRLARFLLVLPSFPRFTKASLMLDLHCLGFNRLTRNLRLQHRIAMLTLWAASLILVDLPPFSAFCSAQASRPNVIVIVADDMGYSDLGCYGGDIATPNLDALAKNGLRFTQFDNTARCWPTRGSLLTGYYAQQIRRDSVPGVRSGGQGVRPAWAQLLPEMLKPLGYRSYHSGKWHVDGQPLEGGFDHSYLLQDAGRFFSPRVHFADGNQLPAVEPGSGYYSTTAIADYAIKHLQEHAQQHPQQPFFSYIAFLSPHFPLQAIQSDIDRYAGKYDSGWEAMRQARWDRIQSLGLVRGKLSPPEREVGPPYDFPDALEALGPGEVNKPLPWNDLTAEQKKFQATKMEIHAAMVDRMDQEIGRVVAQLKAMNALDNTLILFLSDNGASAEIMVRDDGHDRNAPPGSAATHLCLGPGWSTVANTPLRMHKTWVHEGGISTPLVAHWPRGISTRGELRTTPSHVIDLVPTILHLAGASSHQPPATSTRPPPPGRTLLPAFAKDNTIARDYLWWLHEGSRAIRVGDWKLVAAAPSLRGRGGGAASQEMPGTWELYNLAEDRAETNDLATKMPDRVRELESLWAEKRDEFFKLAAVDVPEGNGKQKRGKKK